MPNGMKILPIIIISLCLSGCAGTVKTIIEIPEGNKVCIVQSKKDALVKVEKDGIKIEIDNRGAPGWFEMWIQHLMFKAAPTIELGNKAGDE